MSQFTTAIIEWDSPVQRSPLSYRATQVGVSRWFSLREARALAAAQPKAPIARSIC
jgi:hypothetical protein